MEVCEISFSLFIFFLGVGGGGGGRKGKGGRWGGGGGGRGGADSEGDFKQKMQIVYWFCQVRVPWNQLSLVKSDYKIIMYYDKLKLLFNNRCLLINKQNLE